MKAYTDLEQSKKLAEILPLESADMWYGNEDPYKMAVGQWNDNEHDEDDIPCWSLAALLEIISFPELSKDRLGEGKVGWMVSIFPENCRYDSDWHDNPIDACYELILKLHEQKLL